MADFVLPNWVFLFSTGVGCGVAFPPSVPSGRSSVQIGADNLKAEKPRPSA